MHYRLSSRSIRTRFEPCSDSYESNLVAANRSNFRIVPFEELKRSSSVFIPTWLDESVSHIRSTSRINHRRYGTFGSPPQDVQHILSESFNPVVATSKPILLVGRNGFGMAIGICLQMSEGGSSW